MFCALVSCGRSRQGDTGGDLQRPNIVYILADDLGIGDLSCYGQQKFSTPNIDELCSAGMKFTEHYSGSTVCAPSRSSLMTGLHTGHTFIRGNKEIEPEGQYPLSDKVYTLAEAMHEAGYVTGAFGKWGLGYPGSEGDPVKQGFDEFFGYNCQRMAHHYYPNYLWHNQEKIMLKGNEGKQTGEYGPSVIHGQALKFMEENKEKPFFMFYPSIIPHAELFAPNEYMEKYRGKFLPEKVFEGVDEGEGFRTGRYGSQPESHAAFAAMVNVLDTQVGEIVAKLKELGIYDNTLIIFSSDNGTHMEGGADPDYFDSNGIFKGYKRDLYEGGIHVPMIAVWKGKIAPASSTNHISAFWDVFPTLAEITDAQMPEVTDGISLLPVMLGKEGQKEHEYLYWEFHESGGKQAIRKGRWKLIRNNVSHPLESTFELFNLENDPGEENNLSEQHPGLVKELSGLMGASHVKSDVFQFESGTTKIY
jgi:arylsulfatase A-like enzyme